MFNFKNLKKMKNIFKILMLFILIAQISNKCKAQESIDNRKVFISIHSGLFLPSWSEFKETYHSPGAFINGISLGIPFTSKGFFVYAKGMYFQKSGNQIIYHSEINDLTGEIITYTSRGDEIIWRHFLINIGIQYNFNFKQTKHELTCNGGITFEKTSEGTVKQKIALTGLFVGVGYEYRVLKKFGLFAEAQYNFNILNMFNLNLFGYELKFKHGGANFNVGMRYYF
jgi:hypothetical protein